MTRGLAIEGNFALEFDNDIWMSIGQQDYSCIDVKLVSREDIEDWGKINKGNINIKNLFEKLRDKRIEKIELIEDPNRPNN